jgi:hypothetical protein
MKKPNVCKFCVVPETVFYCSSFIPPESNGRELQQIIYKYRKFVTSAIKK